MLDYVMTRQLGASNLHENRDDTRLTSSSILRTFSYDSTNGYYTGMHFRNLSCFR